MKTTLLAFVLWPIATGLAQVAELTPGPSLNPEQVVQYQVSTLQHNDDPHTDAGIERTFRFASPSNKTQTGPLEHFVSILKSPAYSPMVNNLGSSVIGSKVEGDRATVIIKVIPEKRAQVIYLFLLTKQHVGELNDCWMTDSVLPIKESEIPSEDTRAI
jgi:hypothetical protein